MSSISSVPPVPFTPPVDRTRIASDAQRVEKIDKAQEKAAQKVSELTATAVAAESVKDSKRGAVLDIRV